MNMGKWDHLLG